MGQDKLSHSDRVPLADEPLVQYLEARRILNSRLSATAEEIAVWVSYGSTAGGLDGYLLHNALPKGSPQDLDDEPDEGDVGVDLHKPEQSGAVHPFRYISPHDP